MDTDALMEREDVLGLLINRDALDEVRERAKLEGQLAGARHFCRQAVRTWHPRAGKKVWTAIDESGDLAALEEITLHAAQWGLQEIEQRLMNQHRWLTPTRLRLQDSFIYKEGFAEGYAIGQLNTVRNLCRAIGRSARTVPEGRAEMAPARRGQSRKGHRPRHRPRRLGGGHAECVRMEHPRHPPPADGTVTGLALSVKPF
jgi:hypothetical protein